MSLNGLRLNRYDCSVLALGQAMKRRDFISLLGSTAAWPLAARAQQPGQVRKIGVLMNFPSNDEEGQASVTAFAQALQKLGWTHGSNTRMIPVGPRTMPIAIADTQKNWSR